MTPSGFIPVDIMLKERLRHTCGFGVVGECGGSVRDEDWVGAVEEVFVLGVCRSDLFVLIVKVPCGTAGVNRVHSGC